MRNPTAAVAAVTANSPITVRAMPPREVLVPG